MVTAPRPIPPAVRDTQARASDPASSAFVSANAGSGKTHVLVQRVIRLLLDGVPPEKILCITFTKAAAANMAERVFSTLGHWVTLDDAALDAAIRDAGVAHPGPKLRMRARELFACALETPGGLKVQTIHALCTRLLQQFPFEANVPARFAVLDERDQNEMMERANLKVLLDASRDPDSTTGRALTTAMASAADVTFKDVVREACLSRDHFMAWTDSAGSVDAAAAQMSAALGVDPGDTIEDIERAIVDGPNLPRSRWKEVALVLATGNKSDSGQAERLREALVFTGSRAGRRISRRVPHRRARAPQVGADQKILRQQPGDRKSVRSGRRSHRSPDRAAARDSDPRPHPGAAAHRDRGGANYRREKQERGLLDYDDLIDKTLAMLDRVSSGWVHYKLDRGVDHVLIDEAQDTSPRQWDIVTHIISEFTSGEGARDGVTRTVFAVGDEKQSIFSFQGAAPREFDTAAQIAGPEVRRCGPEIRSGFLHLFVPFGAGDPAIGRSRVSRGRHLPQHPFGRDRLSDPQCSRRRRAEPDRSLGIAGARWKAGHRRLARAVRRVVADKPRGKARQAHPGRDQVADRKRHDDRLDRQATPACAMATCWCWCAGAATPSMR